MKQTKLSIFAYITALFITQMSSAAVERRVPSEYATIQEALDAAESGDTVLVAPGVYHESLKFGSKSIILASHFLHSSNVDDIYNTVLDGTNAEGETRKQSVIFVPSDLEQGARICGFTIQNGDDGIMCEGYLDIDHNRFVGHSDAIDYEDGGGKCHYNLFEQNYDDAVDLDGACAVDIRYNIMRDNRDDGIEIRLQPYEGDKLLTVISENLIVGNGEDGIQFIDYDTETKRTFVVEGNIIANTKMAGIGFMNNAETREDYRAAQIFEEVWILNNTFVNNEYGVTGSGKGGVQNNIFERHRNAVFLGSFSSATLRDNLLWQNAAGAGLAMEKGEAYREADPSLDQYFVSRNQKLTASAPLVEVPSSILESCANQVGLGATPDGEPMGISFWKEGE